MEQSAIVCGFGRRHDFTPSPEDIIQERLYCIQWTRPKRKGKGRNTNFAP